MASVKTDVARALMDVFAAIEGRRSIAKVLPEMPPRDAIERMLEAATWAPNHHVTEPWRFVVIAGEAREALGHVMAQAKIERMIRQGREIEGEYEPAKAKAMRAPVIIAVASEPIDHPKSVAIEEIEAGGAAVQNMLLAAHALGLATIWRTGDPAYDPAVKAHLGFSSESTIVGFVYVGYPATTTKRVRRTHSALLTTWRGFETEASDGGATLGAEDVR